MRFDYIIGNPPYGVGANMAIKFLNKSCELSDDVRMVLPASFRRDSVLNKVNRAFVLEEEWILPNEIFPRDITTVMQRWVRSSAYARDPVRIFREHPDFEFIKYADKDKATLFIGGAGAGPSGKVKTEGYDHYMPGHHYIVCSDEVRDRLVALQPKLIARSRECGCLPGLGKHDIISVYMQTYG